MGWQGQVQVDHFGSCFMTTPYSSSDVWCVRRDGEAAQAFTMEIPWKYHGTPVFFSQSVHTLSTEQTPNQHFRILSQYWSKLYPGDPRGQPGPGLPSAWSNQPEMWYQLPHAPLSCWWNGAMEIYGDLNLISLTCGDSHMFFISQVGESLGSSMLFSSFLSSCM